MTAPPSVNWESLAQVLSGPRLNLFVAVTGSNNKALKLYEWNQAVSLALFDCLHYAELALRNAASDALVEEYGPHWPQVVQFTRGLPSPHSNALNNIVQKTLDSVSEKERENFAVEVEDVITHLSFGFWASLLQRSNRRELWTRRFRSVFPNAPTEESTDVLRDRLVTRVNAIRNIRNRIAHHKPIFDRPLEDRLEDILQVVEWRDNVCANELRASNSVAPLLNQRP